jgi:amino acid adenylation domain-containing protein/non-ribosomal peptide synthase protein (TIGR01720 family)
MTKDIAIIGMAGRFPDARNIDELYRNLREGRDSVRGIAPERIKETTLPPEKQYKVLGYLADIDKFDHRYFNISKAEALNMSPEQRLLLEEVHKAIENAGYGISCYSDSNTAVYVTECHSKYYEHADQYEPTLISGNSTEYLAARISRQYNLTGNAVVLNTSCSTSLVALHMAVGEIRHGDADEALVCGINIDLFPYKGEGVSLDLNSPDGKSRAFSAEANGMSYGEMVAVVLLKPLEKAIADGDNIHAVIKATAVNNNANRSASPTAPDSEMQARVITAAWRKAEINPENLGYIEAHGSGTQLGDSLEIEGLDKAFRQYTQTKKTCAISTIKSNIGHGRMAAGIAGLIRAVQSLKHKELLPTVHFENPNPIIDFENSAVYVNKTLKRWEKRGQNPRLAAVTSVGASGINSHVVIEEAPAPPQREKEIAVSRVVTVSSKTEEGLKRNIEALRETMEQSEDCIELRDIAVTRNLGRDHYPYRFAVIVNNTGELLQELKNPRRENFGTDHQSAKQVYIFSDPKEELDHEIVDAFLGRYDVFRKHYRRCSELCGGKPGLYQRIHIFQYGWYKQLEALGLTTENLLCTGIGRITGELICGDITEQEAIEEAGEYEKEEIEGVEQRVKALLQRETGREPLFFIEMGPGGEISAELQRQIRGDEHIKVLTVTQKKEKEKPDSLQEIITHLYLANTDIDWKEYYRNYRRQDGRRIELPGNRFEKKRNWLREEPRIQQTNIAEVEHHQQQNLVIEGEETTEIHRIIAEQWRQELGISRYMLDDNFFEIGGDSLKATKVISRLEERYEIGLSFEDIFDFPTIKSLAEYVDSQLGTVQKVALIWKKVLKNEIIEAGDSFFDLGGHSLMANRVLNEVKKEFRLQLDFEDMFANPTLEAFTRLIEERSETALTDEEENQEQTTAIEPAEEKEYYPVSAAQKRLYILQAMEPDRIGYNETQTIDLTGTLGLQRLEKTFRALIGRHEILRTGIHMLEGQPVQRIHRDVHFEIEYTDPEGTGEVEKPFRRPFDLTKPPLLRVRVMKLASGKHRMQIDVHHIITDGTSQDLLAREFVAQLADTQNAGQSGILRVQYKDYAEWQKKRELEDAYKRQKEYWHQRFRGELPERDLPTDRERTAEPGDRGATVRFECNEEETAALRKLAHQHGGTVYQVLLAIYKIKLAKQSGRHVLVVGTPVAGRRHADQEGMIGMFVNTLAVKTEPEPGKNYHRYQEEVKQAAIEAYENQDYPFEELVSTLNIPRDQGRNPLFDVMFVLQNHGTDDDTPQAVEAAGLIIQPVPDETPPAKFDQTLRGKEQGGRILFSYEYRIELYDRSTIERSIKSYKKIVAAVTADPGIRLADIEIITDQEKREIQERFNRTEQPFPQDKTLHQLFLEQAERTPSRHALKGAAGTMTYRQLKQRSEIEARRLRAAGVKTGTIVPLVLERSPEMIVAIYAVLRAGGAYMPIDPDYPQERIRYLLADSSANAVMTRTDYEEKITPGPVVIAVDETVENPANGDKTDEKTFSSKETSQPENPAYVIYTSGTTGKPKGVVVEHRSVVNRLHWMQRAYPIDENDVILQKTPYTFDVSVWEIFWWSQQGAALALLEHGDEKDPAAIIDAMEQYRVTTMHFVPSMLTAFLEYCEGYPEQQVRLKSLKQVFSSGETLDVRQAERFYSLQIDEQTGGLQLINLYGPTEATVDVSSYRCSPDGIRNPVPIGKPIDNIKLYILDENCRQQPVGIPGELYIGGVGVARGYLNRPELTAEKFVKYTDEQGKLQILYKTGDWVRWESDGNIRYHGRRDHQVKIRGNRIELGEIENRLSTVENVKQAVVVPLNEPGGQMVLCAAIVPADNQDNNKLEMVIREKLAAQLPAYMIPAYFQFQKKLPMTPSGKIDRKALANHPQDSMESRGEYRPPRNPVEKKLVEIWESVLGRESVGIDDNFFLIGGDSIKSIQIVSRLNREGLKQEIKDIFRNPTIAKQAPGIRETEPGKEAEQGPVTGEIPLTPIQQEFFERYGNGDSLDNRRNHYNLSVMLRSTDILEGEKIRTVFQKIQAHHDALRITFTWDAEGRIHQVGNDRDMPLSLEEYDYRKRPDAAERQEEIARQLQASLNMEKGPLMKVGLFHRDDGSRILMTTHHLVVDGISWRILLEDIETLIQQQKQGLPLELPLKTDSFKTWAEKLKEYPNTREFRGEKEYWDSRDADRNDCIKPDMEGSNLEKDAILETLRLTAEQTRQLRTDVHRAYGTDNDDIILTALAGAVKETFGVESIDVEQEGHGRQSIYDGQDVGRTVGWFTNKYPVHLEAGTGLEDDPGHLIKINKERRRQIPHKGIGYGLLRRHSLQDGENAGKYRNKPQIMYNNMGTFDTEIRGKYLAVVGEPMGAVRAPETEREYELEIVVILTGGCMEISAVYGKNRFETGTIKRLTTRLKEQIENLIHHCANLKTRDLTPSDVTHNNIDILQLEQLNRRYPLEDVYPLTPMQEAMHYHHQQNPGSTAYIEQISYRHHGEIDPQIQKRTMEELFRRYDVLRMRVLYRDRERPLQLIEIRRQPEVYYEDQTGLDNAAERDSLVEKYKEKDRQRGFDLEKDVLLRVAVHRQTEKESRVTWTFHHILMDGWCLGILIARYRAIYDALKENRQYPEPEHTPYSEYVQWLEQRDKDASREYWKEYQSGYLETVTVPGRKEAGTGAHPYRGERQHLRWDEEQTLRIIKIAAGNRVTVNTLLQAAWAILLGRYNGTRDVIFGTVVSGRPAEIDGIERMVGLFINTIPVRITIDDWIPFNRLLRQVQDRAIESEPHHYTPLAQIQVLGSHKRQLLDHLLVFENYPVEKQLETAGGENHVSDIQVYEHTNYDIYLMIQQGHCISVDIEYNGNVYDEEMVKKVTGHLFLLVNLIIKDENVPVSNIDLLSEAERKQIRDRFNETSRDYPRDKTIHELYREQAETTPDRVALVCGTTGEQFTYGEVRSRAHRLAAALRKAGVRSGDIVAIETRRTGHMLIGNLGILDANAAYMPIDPAYPGARKQYMKDDGNVTQTLTGESIDAMIRETEIPDQIPDQTPDKPNHSTQAAYVMYTSGTTGKPKGVIVEHRSVIRLTVDPDYVTLNTDTRILQTGPAVFDAATFEIWGSQLNGGLLALEEKEVILNPGKVKHRLEKYSINTLWLSSSLYNQYINSGDHGREHEMFAGLKYIVVGGDRLSPRHINILREKNREIKILNGYGPTENTTFSITHDVWKQYETAIPIGKPIGNSTALIIDDYERQQPVGVIGELVVGGDGVARGYQNDPEKTAEKFIRIDGKRYYKTGDRARRRPDGLIEYHGRTDNQVKIRGNRVELGEIERQLMKLDGIEEAAAAVKGEEDKTVVAYIVSNREKSTGEIRKTLAVQLPDYMIPAHIVRLEELPLTPNGKVDRTALPDLVQDRPDTQTIQTGNQPETEIEITLAQIYSKILGKKEVAVNENFFEIGGDSIKAIQVVAGMNRAGYRLEVQELFLAPEICQLAAVVQRRESSAQQEPITGEVPLTPVQKEFWAAQRNEPHHFNQGLMFKTAERWDADTVRAVFGKIQQHHDALRITVHVDGRHRIQRNNGIQMPLWLEELDIRGKTDADTVLETAAARLQAGLNLENGPLMKVGLYHCDDGDRLQVVVHHLVVDGVSWRILLEDIAELFNRYRGGKPLELPPKTDSFQRWARELNRYTLSRKIREEEAYWNRQESEMVGIPEIPVDNDSGCRKVKYTENITIRLSEKETRLLQTTANTAFGTEINDQLLTALGLAVKDTYGHQKCAVALENHGRQAITEDIDVSRTVGWFTVIYPVILDMSRSEYLDWQIISVKETLHRVPLKGIGYGLIKYRNNDRNIDSNNDSNNENRQTPKPRISFNYLGQFDADMEDLPFVIAKENAGPQWSPEDNTDYELSLNGMIVNKRLEMTLAYSKQRIKRETAEILMKHYKSQLVRIIEYCTAREKPELTPVDLTDKSVPLETLRRWQRQYHIEDIQPLTPMQEAIYYHGCAHPDTEAYKVQLSYRLKGPLNDADLQQSLQQLMNRHEVLRTVFLEDDRGRPRQAVLKKRSLEYKYEDLRNIKEEKEKEAFIERYKKEDRKRTYNMSRDNMMRISRICLTPKENEIIWSYHHILMDGWCVGVLNAEFFEIYNSRRENRENRLSPPTSNRTYIRWLESRERAESAQYWRRYHEGYTETAVLPRRPNPMEKKDNAEHLIYTIHLTEEKTQRLNRRVESHRVTLNTVVQVIWAVLLGKYTGKNDVVFGAVVSGRPAELTGVETMVGLFINTIPVRVRPEADKTLSQLIREQQEKDIKSQPHHYYPLVEIQAESPLKHRLLDHIVAFENYPLAEHVTEAAAAGKNSEKLEVTNVGVYEQDNYDFDLLIIPGNRLTLKFQYNPGQFDREGIKMMARHIEEVIDAVVDDTDPLIGDIKISHDFVKVETVQYKDAEDAFGF